jgi:hypothetical protein
VLQKLYLQGNCLTCIDLLSACSRLEELHVSDQQWQQPAGDSQLQPSACEQQQQEQQQLRRQSCQQQEPELAGQQSASQDALRDAGSSSSTGGYAGLRFEAASLQAISGSLRVLCAANCGIQDPGPLAVLQKLHTLDLSGNSIQQLALLQPVLQRLQRLRVLDVRGNPCLQHELKYRDYIMLLAADSLEALDNEVVLASHRAFLLGLHKLKMQEQGDQQEQQQRHGEKQQRGRRPQSQLQHQQLSAQCTVGNPAAGALEAVCGAAVGLSGVGVKLHAVRPPAVRPTAAGGFNASDARIAAALGGTRGRISGGGTRLPEERM